MFNNVFQNKKVLITGIRGFKGSWLALWLVNMGAKVYGIALPKNTVSNIELFALTKEVAIHELDLTDKEKTIAAIKLIGPDFVFHAAAQPLVSLSQTAPANTATNNILSTINVLEALRQLNHTVAAIFVTSDKVYENTGQVSGYKETDTMGGKDVYSASKTCCEILTKAYSASYFAANTSVKVATVRAGNVIGGGDWLPTRIVTDCMAAWNSGTAVTLRNPTALRPWQHVLDALSGYLLTAEKLMNQSLQTGESFNFGAEETCVKSVLEMVTDLARTYGIQDPQAAINVTPEMHYEDHNALNLNIEKSNQLLNWRPALDYSENVKLVATWYANYYSDSSINSVSGFTKKQLEQYIATAHRNRLSWIH